jgi:hypothetical protein
LSRKILKRLEMTGRQSQRDRYQRDIAATEERAEMLKGLIHELVQDIPSRDDGDGDVESA